MGDPRKTVRQYQNPKKRWDKKRIEEEKKLMEFYGLKNKKEMRMLESMLRRKRTTARSLLAMDAERRASEEKELFESLKKLGIMKGKIKLDDVLGLSNREFLERRLATLVWRKGLAATAKQARQFIVHGHISIGDRKVTVPGYLVNADEEAHIQYFGNPMQIAKKETKETLKKKFEDVAEKQKQEKNTEAKKEEESRDEKEDNETDVELESADEAAEEQKEEEVSNDE
jgi:small subunit ribosomal protein S4